MKIGIVGAGRIGGGIARQLASAGHEVKLSFSREPAKLERLAEEIGAAAGTGTPAEAVEFGEVVVISVPWGELPSVIDQLGSLDGKIVIDTTNQFGAPPLPPDGVTAARFNAERMPGARYTKSFNTLTSRFQAETAGRDADRRVVQWLCGDDEDAKRVVAGLIEDAGFVPVDVGGTAGCAVMEAPRRPGAVYGEEYRLADARAVVDAVRAGEPIPPTPSYDD
jgi:predicted dinucleotide-binding enzyme